MIVYKHPDGKYYVESVALNGTYDVKIWPSEEVVANRDYAPDAVFQAMKLAKEE